DNDSSARTNDRRRGLHCQLLNFLAHVDLLRWIGRGPWIAAYRLRDPIDRTANHLSPLGFVATFLLDDQGPRRRVAQSSTQHRGHGRVQRYSPTSSRSAHWRAHLKAMALHVREGGAPHRRRVSP